MLNNFEKFSFPYKKKKTDIHKEKKTDILKEKKADREIKGRQLRDHRGIIFASLYTIIKNKMGDIFISG